MNKYKNIIPRKGNRYPFLRQALEQRMLYDATLVHPPSDPAVTGDNDASAHEVSQAVPKPQPTNTQNDNFNGNNTDKNVGQNEKFAPDKSNTEANKDTSKVNNQNQLMEFHEFSPANKEIVFVDKTLRDDISLLKGISPDAEIHFLDMSKDISKQMSDVINNEEVGISAVRILTAGDYSEGQLISEKFSNLRAELAEDIASWHSHLVSDATITWYGHDDNNHQGASELSVLDLTHLENEQTEHAEP